MRTLNVELENRSYPIHMGCNLLSEVFWTASLPGRHVLVVSDENVAALYLQRTLATLSDFECESLVFPAGEAQKSLTNYAAILEKLAQMKASRDATVVALGGGVIGDLAGFAAASWMRGVAFVQLPTTLLAQVDSSVGGKTAINLPQGKNLVGAFHQPIAVVADLSTLSTLAPRELAAGLAEVVKYGAIRDADFLDWLETHADALRSADQEILLEAVERCCRHKAEVVRNDEREHGERALLNFGHTFGHALEAEAGYGELLHGEAVAIGMLLAARMSAELGHADKADAQRLGTLLNRLGLPVSIPGSISAQALLGHMRLDKKALSGKMRFILWRGCGQAFVCDDVADEAVLQVCRHTA